MFSTLKIIKTNRRTNLRSSTLSDLLEIKLRVHCLLLFSAENAVSRWWDECKTTPRVSQRPRKKYKPREKTRTSSEAMDQETLESESTLMLEDWDDWFGEHLSTSTILEPAHSNNSDHDSDSSILPIISLCIYYTIIMHALTLI